MHKPLARRFRHIAGDRSTMHALSYERLDALAEQYASSYETADPFPHVVMEDFANPDFLRQVCSEFPDRGTDAWGLMNDRNQKKTALNDPRKMGPATVSLINLLNGRDVINFLERLTGISGLLPDPHLAGGGLHEIHSGGMLKVHADFNYHEHLKVDRRLNLLLYLNEDWSEHYGGHLQLWDKEMRKMVRKVSPIFNRSVVFSTTDDSYHGHPDPLTCPEDRSRRSIAMYYYTVGRPRQEQSAAHQTLFKQREHEASLRDRVSSFAQQLLPPIVTSTLRRVREGRLNAKAGAAKLSR